MAGAAARCAVSMALQNRRPVQNRSCGASYGRFSISFHIPAVRRRKCKSASMDVLFHAAHAPVWRASPSPFFSKPGSCLSSGACE